MKITTPHTKEVWQSGDFVGRERQATVRAVISRVVAPHPQYWWDNSKDFTHSGYFQCLKFGQSANRPRELPNIKSVKWSRGVDTDVAACTIVLSNVDVRNDRAPANDHELDFPGYFTPNRGTETFFDEWGYEKNEWAGWLAPDRVIQTFEGYGISPDVAPEKDPHLYPSGVWLIDDVDLTADGLITLSCRDMGRALLDQVVFPPAVPWGAYPLTFQPYENRGKAEKTVIPNGGWKRPVYETDSNQPYRNSGIRDRGRLLVNPDGTAFGRHGRDAFDGNTFNWWTSPGKRTPTQSDAVEYLQGRFASPQSVAAVKINAQHGRYRVYISLQDANGQWLGRKRVPYKARDVNTGANIPYVHSFKLRWGENGDFKLPKTYGNIKRIRYSFASLPWTGGMGDDFQYRANINEVAYASSAYLGNAPGTYKYGNFGDYTEIIKWLCGWAGFYWPNYKTGLDIIRYSDGTTAQITPEQDDPVLGEMGGRIWGDFENTGTKSLTVLDVDVWDKKPFMDGIAYIRDIVGFDFWIDETGGVIWRMPNVWKKGCYIMPTKGGTRSARTTNLVEIDERTVITDLSVKTSSKNIRERVYVGNAGGGVGAVVNGYYPDYTGMRRYAGWTDQKFGSNAECERMADLIAIRQSFLYRQANVTIAANPAIQPDDQVVIQERTTGEGYIHRVLNISSDIDLETGRWEYTLTTNWLGSKAFTNLAWDPKYLRDVTKVFLAKMKRL